MRLRDRIELARLRLLVRVLGKPAPTAAPQAASLPPVSTYSDTAAVLRDGEARPPVDANPSDSDFRRPVLVRPARQL
jgi:hypothetical protein